MRSRADEDRSVYFSLTSSASTTLYIYVYICCSFSFAETNFRIVGIREEGIKKEENAQRRRKGKMVHKTFNFLSSVCGESFFALKTYTQRARSALPEWRRAEPVVAICRFANTLSVSSNDEFTSYKYVSYIYAFKKRRKKKVFLRPISIKKIIKISKFANGSAFFFLLLLSLFSAVIAGSCPREERICGREEKSEPPRVRSRLLPFRSFEYRNCLGCEE